jgi:hypothetical protein
MACPFPAHASSPGVSQALQGPAKRLEAIRLRTVWVSRLCESLRRTPFFDAFGPHVLAAVTKQAREAAATAARDLQEQFRALAEYQGILWPQ